MVVALPLLLSASPALSAEIPFDLETDSLCFLNFDPELATMGLLGKLGAKKGICQGIAGTAAAFLENVEFDPSGEKPASERQARGLVRDAIRLHKRGCGDRVRIPGYSSLNELCRDHRRMFLKRSLYYNADIALHEILAVLPRFLIHKAKPVTKRPDRLRIHRALESIERDLEAGRAPLLMYYSHVVLVHALRYEASDGRVARAVLDVYDSNVDYPRRWTVEYGADGLPAPGNRMIWNVTPSRGSCR